MNNTSNSQLSRHDYNNNEVLLDSYVHRDDFAQVITHVEGAKRYKTEAIETEDGTSPAEVFCVVMLSAEQFRKVQEIQKLSKANGTVIEFESACEKAVEDGIRGYYRSVNYTYTNNARKASDADEARLMTQYKQGKLTPAELADALEASKRKFGIGGSNVTMS